jgi:phosphohistidine phosphatase
MQLLILRHGKAEAKGHKRDFDRELVERGFDQARRAGERLKETGGLPDLVLTSPLVRARQTAESFCKAADLSAPVVQPWIASGMQPEDALAELKAFAEFRRVMIVGHEPDLSNLVHWICGGEVELPTGSLVCLEVSPPAPKGRLLYLLPPSLTTE